MKRAIIFSFFFLIFFISFSQEITIKSIPVPLYFENNPLDYKLTVDNSLQITSGANTDLFISPDGTYSPNSSPRLLFSPDSNFIFTSKITPDFKSNWDAGVLLIYNDSSHFAKFCYETDYQGQPRIVTVVCNERSDDCNSMAVNNISIYYRIIGSIKGQTFTFYSSEDGNSWYLVRTFKLNKTDNIRIGFSSQSPTGKGCRAEFSEISLQSGKPHDFWKGK
ncbi:MAG: DUF1349 domain-containing protein [Bacteroidales bacterium]|nr:DUF1349 domain-containing protein [Bacteroidales bacterium]